MVINTDTRMQNIYERIMYCYLVYICEYHYV